MMYCLKVTPCRKSAPHEWSVCPFAHQGEKTVRRNLRTHYYTGVVCPDMKKDGHCLRENECPFAHSVYEYWLHPTRYRTVMCTEGDKCTRTFCFFAHSPEELRRPGSASRPMAELRKPPEQGRQEATPQNAAHQIKPPADVNTATEDQGVSLPAHGQHMPAPGDNVSTYIPEPLEFIGKPCVEPQQVGMQAPGVGSCGGTVVAADWQGNPVSMDGTAPLVQVRVAAAYLAGFAHALGRGVAAVRGAPQPPQLKEPQPQQLWGSSWVGSSGCCISTYATRRVSDFPGLQGTPLSVIFVPAAHPVTVVPPDIPFSNNTWGAQNPLEINQVDATNPFNTESYRPPHDYIGTHQQVQQNESLPAPGSGSIDSYMEACWNLAEAPNDEMDPLAGFRAASPVSPLNCGGSFDMTSSMQSHICPEFSLF
ncbi:probable zinc finger CCCH domain-containing protein 2 at N-terminal half [Coccomyxa sp. Obi]|nr:probable zinc finger CCCH domain-containing protein 2 at N-terminal half [Coccomyxa sp. Obi]